MGIDLEQVNRPGVLVSVAVTLGALLGWTVWARWPPPQLEGRDQAVFTTVDALFTAITTRDKNRLEQCEKKLQTYFQEKRTSPSVNEKLTVIIQQARSEEWEPAAKELYTFILGQKGR